MPARNIKSSIAVVAAAAAIGFGVAMPASALAAGSGGGANHASTQDSRVTQLIHSPRDDPHTFFDDGTVDGGAQPAVLCATAIEYGLIAAL
jgi:hypothetical protein